MMGAMDLVDLSAYAGLAAVALATVNLLIGLSVAGTLRYFVTPQIVAKFEALNAALRR